MRKTIVCLTCERLIEIDGCPLFDVNHEPNYFCYKILETYKLEEIGRLWMKSKNKIIKALLSRIDELERARTRYFRIPESWNEIDDGTDYITETQKFDFTRYKK